MIFLKFTIKNTFKNHEEAKKTLLRLKINICLTCVNLLLNSEKDKESLILLIQLYRTAQVLDSRLSMEKCAISLEITIKRTRFGVRLILFISVRIISLVQLLHSEKLWKQDIRVNKISLLQGYVLKYLLKTINYQ